MIESIRADLTPLSSQQRVTPSKKKNSTNSQRQFHDELEHDAHDTDEHEPSKERGSSPAAIWEGRAPKNEGSPSSGASSKDDDDLPPADPRLIDIVA